MKKYNKTEKSGNRMAKTTRTKFNSVALANRELKVSDQQTSMT